MDLTGSVCVVTGASSGIGRRTLTDMAAAGARVCAVARRADRLAELVATLGGEDAGHSYAVCDVSARADVARMAAHVRDRYGRCDVLVNSAGIASAGPFRGVDSIADVERVVAVNFFGAVYCTAELMPLLVASAPSHVVNVASVAGRLAVGDASTYCASKFALVGWTESLHHELADRGVWATSVEPGFIPTEGFPQTDLARDPVMRHLLGSVDQVSSAIVDAIARRKMQRVVPRWYYLLQIPRLLAPPLHRLALRTIVAPRQRRRSDG